MSESKKVLIIEDDESWYEPIKLKLNHSDFDFKTHVETTCAGGFITLKTILKMLILYCLILISKKKGAGWMS